MSESAAIRPRPVWERYLRRKSGIEVGPPSDEEKSDAISVLREAPLFGWAPGGAELVEEAERIFIEASE